LDPDLNWHETGKHAAEMTVSRGYYCGS